MSPPRPPLAPLAPIAILGMACRVAGAVGLEPFWRLLASGADGIGEVPPERWDVEAFYRPGRPRRGKVVTRWGGFLDGIDRFDARFFDISAQEARAMDPQQRFMLEVAWEALEDAAIPPDRLAGTAAGVYVGMTNHDYDRLMSQDYGLITPHSSVGTIKCFVANRISYVLGLRGPSLAIDTACSSSLVALHLACQGLACGETDLALVGGVNAILSPHITIGASLSGLMSATGRCRSFDAAADGYVRSEGCAAVVLKRLDDALADGDPVRAVVRGTAANHNGKSNGISSPNGPAQRELIARCLARAGVEPAQVGLVEAHGTGTLLGDPIEFNTLRAVIGEGRAGGAPCAVGTMKSNLGHMESAAGLCAVVKTVLCLEREAIPPVVHLRQVNPYVKLEGSGLEIPTALKGWPRGAPGAPGNSERVACVSSFGLGGANAFAVLAEAPAAIEVAQAAVPDRAGLGLLVLSAKSETALAALAGRYADLLAARSEIDLDDLCFTAMAGRSHFPHRLALVAQGKVELREALAAFAAGLPGAPEAVRVGRALRREGAVFRGREAGEEVAAWANRIAEELAAAFPEATGEPGTAGIERLRRQLAALYRLGAALDWQAVARAFAGRRISLPTYPFERESYWLPLRGDAASEERRADREEADREADLPALTG